MSSASNIDLNDYEVSAIALTTKLSIKSMMSLRQKKVTKPFIFYTVVHFSKSPDRGPAKHSFQFLKDPSPQRARIPNIKEN